MPLALTPSINTRHTQSTRASAGLCVKINTEKKVKTIREGRFYSSSTQKIQTNKPTARRGNPHLNVDVGQGRSEHTRRYPKVCNTYDGTRPTCAHARLHQTRHQGPTADMVRCRCPTQPHPAPPRPRSASRPPLRTTTPQRAMPHTKTVKIMGRRQAFRLLHTSKTQQTIPTPPGGGELPTRRRLVTEHARRREKHQPNRPDTPGLLAVLCADAARARRPAVGATSTAPATGAGDPLDTVLEHGCRSSSAVTRHGIGRQRRRRWRGRGQEAAPRWLGDPSKRVLRM